MFSSSHIPMCLIFCNAGFHHIFIQKINYYFRKSEECSWYLCFFLMIMHDNANRTEFDSIYAHILEPYAKTSITTHMQPTISQKISKFCPYTAMSYSILEFKYISPFFSKHNLVKWNVFRKIIHSPHPPRELRSSTASPEFYLQIKIVFWLLSLISQAILKVIQMISHIISICSTF